MKEIFLIGAHVTNNQGGIFLEDLCQRLISSGKDYIISSHTEVPMSCIRNSKGFVYNPENYVVKMWDLKSKGLFHFHTPLFSIKSNILGHGSGLNFYGVAGFNLLRNGMDFLKRSDYEIIHWIEYDIEIDEALELKISDEIMNNDAVYIREKDKICFAGGRFSFKKNSVNWDIMKKSDEEILEMMSRINYFPEFFTRENWAIGQIQEIMLDDINAMNRNVTFRKKPFEWTLFEDEGRLCLFVKNKSEKSCRVIFKIDNRESESVDLIPSAWWANSISPMDNFKNFSIWEEGHEKININLEGENYDKIVRNVIFESKIS